MANNRCIDIISEAAELSPEQRQEIIDHLESLKNDPNARAKIEATMKDLADEAAYNRVKEKLSIAARHKGVQYQDTAGITQSSRAGYGDVMEGYLVGSNKKFFRARDSAYDRIRGAAADSGNRLMADVAKTAGKLYGKLFQDKAFNKLWSYEMAGHATGNRMAADLAKVFRDHYDAGLNRANAAGARIKRLDNYIFATQHDPYKIAKADFAQWVTDIEKTLKPETFGGDDPKEFLHTVFQNILQGSHDDLYNAGQVKGQAGLAKRLSRHKVLIFKNETKEDVDGFLAYNDKYGRGVPMVNAFGQVQHLNAQSALMERMGPNPDSTFKYLLDVAKSKSRDMGKLITSADEERFNKEMKVVTGMDRRTTSATVSHYFAAWRALVSWTHLGTSAISSFSDANGQAMMLYKYGMPMMESYLRGAGTLVKFVKEYPAALARHYTGTGDIHPIESEAFTKGLHSGLDGTVHANGGRWGADPDLSGKIARVTSNYFNINGQAYWDDLAKMGTEKGIATAVAAQRHLSWEALPRRTRDSFFRDGIGEKEWDVIRSSELTTVGGHDHIFADTIKDKEISERYGQMLLAKAETAVPLPGGRQRAFFANIQRGDVFSELALMMMQFKAFPLSMMGKVWPQALEMGVPGVTMAVLGSIPFGYASIAIKNVIEGKDPPDPRNAATWLASFLQGGAGSLPADLVTHRFDKTYTVADFIAGPAASDLQNIAAAPKPIYDKIVNDKRIPSSVIGGLSRDVPFANLWFAKAAYQNLIVNQLQEANNPGYLQRTRAKAAKEYDEHYWLPPK